MASCELNDFNARHGSQEVPPLSALKSFNAQLAVHYPTYTMVVCQHWQVKAVNDVCSTISDRKSKNDSYFRQLRLISASILPTSNQTLFI